MKEHPINGDLEQLLDETRDKRAHLQQHLTVYQSLCMQLEAAAKLAGKPEHNKVMKEYEEYVNLVLEAEKFMGGMSSKMAMIKNQMDFKLHSRELRNGAELKNAKNEKKNHKNSVLVFKGLFLT